ncbi:MULTISPECIES: preprotein translocase subunit SecE [Larsenimonas]|uniref:Protein translocase subunit SecE n=1 Tax=Larsenimonas suaedae TaxID=1851019 RepID=A0ABU1GYW6_9GAMM|nr:MULTISPECIES: preprotein translocase subunit SecE [Larsenimonas]MCM2973627.1 preprotein translocase subunit SecE [Larsenimonas suaedae]MCM5705449.1 preprotein translocase subunit SecE [Larsenimonas salina]MDR5897239.1 preprotein translocase subunit SecE [Larsenimonas suaedae]
MKHEAEVQESRHDALKWAVVVVLVAAIVVGNSFFSDLALLYRVLGITALGLLAAFVALMTKQGKELSALAKNSRKEIQRVVWPSRQETFQTTAIVLVAVLVVGLVLWLIDTFFGWVVSGIIG